jgi:electron transport complex protein RnfD
MATDVVTSPVTKWGRLVFGAGAGVVTLLVRIYGAYPEGVCYSILLMNALTPLIDRYTFRTCQNPIGEVSVKKGGTV